jgi:NAD(P)-dependent dehydrogenase (short-subunit alcohol dehydrogenase family)
MTATATSHEDAVSHRAAGRVVLVTGSAGGIGSALCTAFASLGDVVIGLDLQDGFDVTDPAACDRRVEEIAAEHGRIDVLCNNAGVGSTGDVVSTPADDWLRVLDVNVLGLVNITRPVVRFMRDNGGGAIVNTCSVAADIGLVDRVAYSASKGAVLALTRAMAADEVRHGIRVNAVSPATVDGPWVERLVAAAPDPRATRARLEARQPMGRLVTAREVAAAVVFLAAPTTATTGSELRLDAGITGLLPGART